MFSARIDRTILAYNWLMEVPMPNPVRSRGFSLIEAMLVVAIIGIISAIAIPSFLGQRRRARTIGDAIANAKVLQMALESLKSDTGLYGAAGTYDWKANGSAATGPALISTFQPAPAMGTTNASKMDYDVVIANGGISYQLTVNDPNNGGAMVYQTNQLGTVLFQMQ
jgi:prepilin-type N-terminal cleavage/methylation domain-containing protein